MGKKLKKYELKINVKDGAIVSAIALVNEPAVESNFLAFAKEYSYQEFTANDEKMELIGVAMLPNQLIYRKDKTTGEEFEVFFSEQTIREIAQQYFKMGYQSQMNIGHTSIPAKSYIFQSFIVDAARGILAPKGISAPDGAWIIGVKVEDFGVWKDIKAGKTKGFSIEGMFEFLDSNFSIEEESDEEVLQLLSAINRIIKNKK